MMSKSPIILKKCALLVGGLKTIHLVVTERNDIDKMTHGPCFNLISALAKNTRHL